MKKAEKHLIKKRGIVLIGVMTGIRNLDISAIRFALCPNRCLLFDLLECILLSMCEQERHWKSIIGICMKKTGYGFPHRNPCFQRSTCLQSVCFDFWPYPNHIRQELFEFCKGDIVSSLLHSAAQGLRYPHR